MSRLAVLAFVLFVPVVFQGCAASHWEREFIPESPVSDSAVASPLPTEAPVSVREVDWKRLIDGLEELKEAEARSDVPRGQWPESRQREHKAAFLRTLQVTGEPKGVHILGRTEFRTTAPLKPQLDSDLRRFARKIGANEVVWARFYLGKTEEIVREPVTTYTTGTDFSRRGSDAYSESSTSWVPVVVDADEFEYAAYFLRR